MKIHKNFLEKNYFNHLKKVITSDSFPWYRLNYLVEKDWDNISNFYHMIYRFYKPTSDLYNLIEPIIIKLNPISLIRIRANLYVKNNKPIQSPLHIDIRDAKEKFKTGILYINKNNGPTIINNKKINPEENKFVEFDGFVEHKATLPTDKDKILINFNWYESK